MEENELPDELTEDEEYYDWGLESEEQKAGIIIRDTVEFVTRHDCLLGPTFDLDNHIAILSGTLDCPTGTEQRKPYVPFMCPCERANSEIKKNGHTSCGLFVTQKHLKQSKHADQLPSCKAKTKVLLIRYDNWKGLLSDSITHRQNVPVYTAYQQFPKEQIDELLFHLTPREQQVLKLRFGLEGKPRTLKEVGREFNVSRERIRQIEDKALRKIRGYIRHDRRLSKEELGK